MLRSNPLEEPAAASDPAIITRTAVLEPVNAGFPNPPGLPYGMRLSRIFLAPRFQFCPLAIFCLSFPAVAGGETVVLN
jgi:hypothetical protein